MPVNSNYTTFGDITPEPRLVCQECKQTAIKSECNEHYTSNTDFEMCDCCLDRHTCSNGHVWVAEEEFDDSD